MMMHHDANRLFARPVVRHRQPGKFPRKTGQYSDHHSLHGKGYEEPFTEGMVIDEAAAAKSKIIFDGNHCIATKDPKPWRKQSTCFSLRGLQPA